MSSFFVGDDTITRCVTAILRTCETFGQFKTYGGDPSLPYDDNQQRAGTQIGTALRAMNADALRARYGARTEDVGDLHYSFPGPSDAHPAALLKALHCLSYQCEEGDIPETNPLLPALDDVMARIAATGEGINENHVAYQRAHWGD